MAQDFETSSALESLLSEFRKLRAFCDDEPNQLLGLVKSDVSVLAQCLKLYEVDRQFKKTARRERSANFDRNTKGVAQDYLRYHEVYSDVVREIHKVHAGSKHDVAIDLFEDETLDEKTWWIADEIGRGHGGKIDAAVIFGISSLIEDKKLTIPPLKAVKISDGFDLLDDVNQTLGVNWPSIFRRRELVPNVFIPQNVSWKLNPDDTETWLSYLQEAQDCFVFGQTRASVAVLRSISEKILKRHYNRHYKPRLDSDRKSLAFWIDNAVGLPSGCDRVALHRLRETANQLLHDTDTMRGLNSVSLKKTDLPQAEVIKPVAGAAGNALHGDTYSLMTEELKIVRYFKMLKVLIESISK